jgi:hypothetical protein
MNTKDRQAMIAKMQRVIAIRQHTLGVTDSCPQCEENGTH